MKLKFIYGDIPFWRAEVGRLALYFGNIDFEDIRITRDEFLYLKENGKLLDGTLIPFHQIPCLVVDDVSIAQTGAIARFCGKLSGLYPEMTHLKQQRLISSLILLLISMFFFQVQTISPIKLKKFLRARNWLKVL